jgi:hypothetical protein
VDLAFTRSAGEIHVELLDPEGNVQASSLASPQGERLQAVLATAPPATLPATATWQLRVFGDNEGNSYDLWWDDRPLHPGDADLNGRTDVRDFNIWNAHKFVAGTDWTTGDFNADGRTDVRDFNVWNEHKFTAGPLPPSPAPPNKSTTPQTDTARTHDIVLEASLGRVSLPGTFHWLMDLDQIVASDAPETDGRAERNTDRLLATYWP